MFGFLNAKKTSWTRIDDIKITYKYGIKKQDGDTSLISCSVNIYGNDLKQGPEFEKDWSLSNDKCSEILNMISKADEYKKNQRFLWNLGLEIIAHLSNDKYSDTGHFTADLKYGFENEPGIRVYVYQDRDDSDKYRFIGKLNGDSFHLSHLDGTEKYRKCGFAHIMILLFGLAIPFLESYSGQELLSIYGTVANNGGYDPDRSIPFYKELSGTTLPFGKKMILDEETELEPGESAFYKIV